MKTISEQLTANYRTSIELLKSLKREQDVFGKDTAVIAKLLEALLLVEHEHLPRS
jgi:hypothetical protein